LTHGVLLVPAIRPTREAGFGGGDILSSSLCQYHDPAAWIKPYPARGDRSAPVATRVSVAFPFQ